MKKSTSNSFVNTSSVLSDAIIFRSDSQTVRINTDDILYIEALADYVIIKTELTRHITLSTMKDMVKLLQGRGFVRTHRSFIVNMDKIELFKGSSIVVKKDSNPMVIPVGRVFKKEIKELLAA